MKTKKLCEQLIDFRKDWVGCFAPNQVDMNITYNLLKSGCCGACEDMSDVMVVYDNLVVNNELITLDNVEEYEEETLIKHMRKHGCNYTYETILRYLNKGYVFLMNYYTTKGKLKECWLKYDTTVNYFKYFERGCN